MVIYAEFQVITWFADDLRDESGQYTIKAFGRSPEGSAVSLTVTGYKPFFYIKLTSGATLTSLGEHLRTMGIYPCGMTAVKRKDLLGFTNFQEFDFLKLSFNEVRSLRFAAKALQTKPCGKVRYKTYESNVEPLLRFFHEANIDPVGSIRVPVCNAVCLKTHIGQDMECKWSEVKPSHSAIVTRFLVMSFDLECGSLDGDFPVAKKDFRRVAQVLADTFATWSDISTYGIFARTVRFLGRATDSERCLGEALFTFDHGETTRKLDKLTIPRVSFASQVEPKALADICIKVKEIEEGESPTYEGAIVLEPQCGMYLDDPVTVLDYASLYPSSMISENLSHDCLVMDPTYDNLPGETYVEIVYDVLDDKKNKTSQTVCRFAQSKQGLIPRTLMRLLDARKATRSKLKEVTDPFQRAILDGLQNAYKVTANSLYGQMGSRTSQLFLKDIAACTTATGRLMITKAKSFLEARGARVVYGDTDSIFCVFPSPLKGAAAIPSSMQQAIEASEAFKKIIKRPHDLELDKTLWPFVLLSKKRYVGNAYEDPKHPEKFVQKSMGIVLKRRDNAPIVKKIYGGVIDILLNRQDLLESCRYLRTELLRLIDGDCPLEDLIVSKSLKFEYKDPTRIAHKVLVERMAERDPGNRPQIGDRIPYVYCTTASTSKKNCLQGERIEHPEFVRTNRLIPDYHFYITNQIMKPILQIFALVCEQLEGFDKPRGYFEREHVKFQIKNMERADSKLTELREKVAMELLFQPVLGRLSNKTLSRRDIQEFFKSKPVKRIRT
ncbi:hypothetical protein CEUSTIGMA_g12563.t1 [Chlamydomonas eustigma]|uniref:DNA polymerase n=1 Tax=Chlamydomonas eustigma TaxID=1157962 RepID=A0A250XPY3_9CHLO|nr:hypothetical protein CEUSTIGMA_g12563.t1 [Chlamydomonas eustigma]|eukprot:GAX85144.1 hypothetical protein CEUSTIGMA_g12563.t1 [Chlamydomonas eustigma]